MKPYVILGNGIAAAACIEGIRQQDTETPIVVISQEQHPVYCRPLISYYLEQKTDLTRIPYREPDFYRKNHCIVRYGETAVSIDVQQKTVSLAGAERFDYAKLCIATGSSPFTPPIDGIETVSQRFCFMTLDDALALERAVTPESRVLILGAGLIGLKCAEGLHGRVGSITVCDLADRILPSVLDADTAPVVQRHLEKKGIRILLSDRVARFDGNQATLQSGDVLDFDLLVTAVGVRPNIQIARDAGLQTERGICIDAYMQTSVSDIYAAGDCVQCRDCAADVSRVLALLPNANMQGHAAGVNMAGGAERFDHAVAMNAIGLFGLPIMTAGVYPSPQEGAAIYQTAADNVVRKIFVQDNFIKGFIFIGDVTRGGLYTSLIRKRVPLDTLQFDLLFKNPTFLAFCAEDRKAMFGGVV